MPGIRSRSDVREVAALDERHSDRMEIAMQHDQVHEKAGVSANSCDSHRSLTRMSAGGYRKKAELDRGQDRIVAHQQGPCGVQPLLFQKGAQTDTHRDCIARAQICLLSQLCNNGCVRAGGSQVPGRLE